MMREMSRKPMMDKPVAKTATGVMSTDARNNSDVQTWIGATEAAGDDIMDLAGLWTSTTVEAEMNIFSDFIYSMRSIEESGVLDKMRGRGDLSLLTFLKEMKRLGLLSETVIVEEEVLAIQAETSLREEEEQEEQEDDDDPPLAGNAVV